MFLFDFTRCEISVNCTETFRKKISLWTCSNIFCVLLLKTALSLGYIKVFVRSRLPTNVTLFLYCYHCFLKHMNLFLSIKLFKILPSLHFCVFRLQRKDTLKTKLNICISSNITWTVKSTLYVILQKRI